MKAVVYAAVGAVPELLEVPAPSCPADGAVVAVHATGVCRSDWHAWRGHDPVPLPQIPGHEFAGVVAEVGPQVTGFAVGDRVTVPFVNGCGACEWCRSGQAQVCPSQTQPGFTGPGSFAEMVAVPAADFNLVRLPDGIDSVTAASLGCRFATAYHALTAQAGLAAGEWLAVHGCGGVGLSAVQIGVALGARVVAVDVSADALARARVLGATTVMADADTAAAVVELTGGGAHVSMDALGSATTAQASLRCLRRRGRHLQVGLMFGDDLASPMPWDLVVSRELELLGCHGMAARDYPAMLALIADGALDPRPLLGRVVGLEDAGAELMAMDRPSTTGGGIVVARVAAD